MSKPLGDNYLSNPVTLGEKIRNRRIELGLFQKDVAKLFGVTTDTITFWENNRNEPTIPYYKKIADFLGYFPFKVDVSTIGGQLKLYRYKNGLSQEDLAKQLGINESTVFHCEKNTHKPSSKLAKKIVDLLGNYQ